MTPVDEIAAGDYDGPPPAFQGELMLAGWSESHNGGAKVAFWLPDAAALDAFRAMTVRKGNTAGQRFMAVLVEIGEDERPVVHARPGDAQGPLCRSAVLVCRAPDFHDYVNARTGVLYDDRMDRIEQAEEFVRARCGVTSRRELDTNAASGASFRALMTEYHQWLEARRGA